MGAGSCIDTVKLGADKLALPLLLLLAEDESCGLAEAPGFCAELLAVAADLTLEGCDCLPLLESAARGVCG